MHLSFSLLFLSDRIPKSTEEIPHITVNTVGIYQWIGPFQVKGPLLIHVAVVHRHMDHIGKKHVMGTQLKNLPNLTFYVDRLSSMTGAFTFTASPLISPVSRNLSTSFPDRTPQ